MTPSMASWLVQVRRADLPLFDRGNRHGWVTVAHPITQIEGFARVDDEAVEGRSARLILHGQTYFEMTGMTPTRIEHWGPRCPR